ncbi:MAG: glycoside hydrolase/phage tail family protein [Pseudomonadota bacterium]|jgi:hypothetical protein
MAQLVLQAVGTAIGGPIGGAVGRTLGGIIDRDALAALLGPKTVGRRLAGLQLNGVAEGAPLPAAFGRARVAAQIIWTARFKESRVDATSGGGKGAPSPQRYQYSLSFAAALGEGPIDGIGRIWADGQLMDLTHVTMRVYLGTDDQTPDPLIEAVEGAVPAYRGVAYLVFEDLVLDPYGARPPNLNVEVFRRPRGPAPALEDRVQSVCLIPGAGEFVYGTVPVLRQDGLTITTPENVHTGQSAADLLASLDQLQAAFPNLAHVALVVAWFGDDLRCGTCRLRPGVEQANKATVPYAWSAGGVGRSGAHLISSYNGGPAFGGTPADAAVVAAIAELKRRGLGVTLYPFVLMDIPAGNALPDPYGGAAQGAYPWRGRITGFPAAGQPGSVDLTASAAAQVASFFGTAAPADYAVNGTSVSYSGSDGWSYRRMILHYAHLAAAAGGVESFLIGSELRGLTTLRSAPGQYPAVSALQALACDCASVLGPSVAIGYGADWSEYFGHQPADGSGDVDFHLDPLWADPHIGFVGVDWYAPITDWRDGAPNADAVAGYRGTSDPAYLAARIAGGEAYDFYYKSPADRLAQTRTPITDGAYGEPWVYRAKDLLAWWSNPHHDRPGGVRRASPTAWGPQMKPIRFTEFGCPAVDKGANAPNLFIDPKSAESALPPFSTGARDDLGQRRALEAILGHFQNPAANPVSSVYGAPMLDLAHASLWCWDARPYPAFPARADVWADASAWSLGHWLNGRAGAAPGPDLVAALLLRGGINPAGLDLSGAEGVLEGYVADGPVKLADSLADLADALDFDPAERGGVLALVARTGGSVTALTDDDLALPDANISNAGAHAAAPSGPALARTLKPLPDVARVRFADAEASYQVGQAFARAGIPTGGGELSLDLAVVATHADALQIGARALARAEAGRDTATAYVSALAALSFEPGDLISLPGSSVVWKVSRVDLDGQPRLSLLRAYVPPPAATLAATPSFVAEPAANPVQAPLFQLLDLPPLIGFEDDARPLACVAAQPFAGADVWAGPSLDALSLRAELAASCPIGETLSPLAAGPLWRLDLGNRLTVTVEGTSLASCSPVALSAGANAAAVQTPAGAWEVLQYQSAVLTAPGTYLLSGLLRGQQGSEADMAALIPAGAAFVPLSDALARLNVTASECTLPLIWRAVPHGAAPGGAQASERDQAWMGIAYRPFAPVHLAAQRQMNGDLMLSWVRRTRVGGDSWEGVEVPLGEEREAYLVTIFNAGVAVRSYQTTTPGLAYPAADQGSDFPAGTPRPLSVSVAQLSAVFGWGAAARASLLY